MVQLKKNIEISKLGDHLLEVVTKLLEKNNFELVEMLGRHTYVVKGHFHPTTISILPTFEDEGPEWEIKATKNGIQNIKYAQESSEVPGAIQEMLEWSETFL